MKQIVKDIIPEKVDQMIILKYHRRVASPNTAAFVSNKTLGKIYGVDASSIGRLIK